MEPKRANLKWLSLLFCLPKTASIFDRFWACFVSLWTPFGLPFGSFWLLLASLLAPFGLLWAPFWCFLSSFGFLSASWSLSGLQSFSSPAEAKFWRDLAEILPRTCQEFAKNQPRTRRMNLKQSCLSNCKFFETTSFADKPFHKIA